MKKIKMNKDGWFIAPMFMTVFIMCIILAIKLSASIINFSKYISNKLF